MGLGKTIQVIAFFASLSYTGTAWAGGKWRGLGPSIVVCPATVLRQWVTEFHAWWPPLRVAVLHSSGSHSGTPRNLIRAINSTLGGILVMSYQAVVTHAEQLAGLDWHYVVLDEGHKIRNPEAQVNNYKPNIIIAYKIDTVTVGIPVVYIL
jgi:DNA excision repair protein ERCC-6